MNQNIKCSVHDCKHCDCTKDECTLNVIKICDESKECSKEATMCDSYEENLEK